MKKIKKLLAGSLAFVLIATMCAIGMTAYAASDDVVGNYNFDITSTYANVDWDNWKPYKAETHVHTVRSDADTEIDDMIEYYYGFDFDAMALTDHGTVNYGWTKDQTRIAIFDYQFFVHGAMDELSEARYKEITTGTGAISGGSAPRGFGMREIPLGIELNGMSTKKCHINGFYVDYGHGDLGLTVTWPRDAVAGNYKAGGLTHINHVGEWSDAKSDRSIYDAKFISDFASIYEDYGIMKKNRDESNLRGCLGMELVNTADSRTRNDRYLYDEIMKILAPQGINVLAFCEDDAHELSDCDRNAQYFLMPENDMATNNIKHSMEYGEFYTVSKNSKNPYELGDGFAAQGEYPSVSYVGVEDAKNQIIVNSKNANKIRMVADGEIIETIDLKTSGASTVLDLNKYEDKINSYVRVYLTGPGGILYLQPFLVEKAEAPVSSVTFVKPSTDTDVKVYDANGTLIDAVNTNAEYVLDAGNYAYVASRPGYVTTEPIPFTVSQSDVDNAVKRKIDVELEKDENVVYTTFYVPETIYLDGADSMSFKSYVDRENSVNGALNSEVKSTGNIYFNREGVTHVDLSYEIVEGTQLNSMTIGQIRANGSTLATTITAGKMSSAVPSGGHSLIKWTATYTSNGKEMKSYAYSYVYGPLSGGNSTVAAGGQATTKKNITSWAHTTMHITATVWMAGVHSVKGGSAGYKFTPYGGAALTNASGTGNITVSGVGMGVASDDSSGGSKTVTVGGGTGTLTIDVSRYNNLNQIPNFKIGLDVNNCTEGEETTTNYVNFGSQTIYASEQVIEDSTSGKRLYESDNSNPATGVNWSIDQSVNSIAVNGYAACNKSKRTDAINGVVTLELKYVDKSALRDQYNNAISFAYQPDWFENESDYNDYVQSVKDAAILLGNPAAALSDIEETASDLANELKDVTLRKGNLTINYVNKLTDEVIETEEKEYTICDTLVGSAEEITGFAYADSWEIISSGTQVATGTNNFANLMATDDDYTMNFYYNPKEYTVDYAISDPAFIAPTNKAVYGKNYTVASGTPKQDGYRFDGWMLEADGKVYAPDSVIKWEFDEDSTFTPVWVAEKYQATYILDGGTGLDKTVEAVSFMDSFQISTVIPTKSGYTFAGWKAVTSKGENLGVYTAGSTISWDVTDNITLTAQWSVVTVEVTLDANGGTLANDKVSVNYGAKYGKLPTPEKTGYNFDGWFFDEELTKPVSSTAKVENPENHTLFAKWSKGQYKISYYLDGKLYTETTLSYGDTIIPEPAPSAEGSTFSGWSEIPATMPAENVVINGSLKANTYKLTFYIDGKVYKQDDVEFGMAITAPVPESKEGSIFSGWSEIPATMPANDVNVYGSYDAQTYNIYYYVDGSLFSTGSYEYGAAITAVEAPAKTGYTFSGWSEMPAKMPAKDVYVYGSYSVAKYKLTYYVDGEFYYECEYAYKDSITPYAEPTKDGSTFSGWSYIPATMPARDYTVNGSFTENTYSYFFMVNGEVRNDLTITAKYGEKITAPVITPEKNYVFSGWTPAVPDTMGKESMYFYGTTDKAYSEVKFSLNGGEGTAPEAVTEAVGKEMTLPTEGFTKDDGVYFAGWSTDENAKSGSKTYTVTADDVTLYAVWKSLSEVDLVAADGSTTIIDDIHHVIYGLKDRITESEFFKDFVDVIGEDANVTVESGVGFGTGTKVTLFAGTTFVKEYTIIVYGDLDGDGVSDGMDVQLARMLEMGFLSKAQVGYAVAEAADCDHDGRITENDIQLIANAGIKPSVIDQTK